MSSTSMTQQQDPGSKCLIKENCNCLRRQTLFLFEMMRNMETETLIAMYRIFLILFRVFPW